jgi:hypothetical protein
MAKAEGEWVPIAKGPDPFENERSVCFVSLLKFDREGALPKFNENSMDLESVESLKSNFVIKGRNSRHIKLVYEIPQDWPEFKVLQTFQSEKSWDRFKRINENSESINKKHLLNYAEFGDTNTYFLPEGINPRSFNAENCDQYIYISYLKKERDFYNSILFLLTLGVLPAFDYENHYFEVFLREKDTTRLENITYKFGTRRTMSWLYIPTFNFFNEIHLYDKEYTFYEHSKDQFFSVLENKYSQPLPIKNLNPVYGDIQFGKYIHDSDLFTTRVPIDKRYGVLRDAKNNVSFSDPTMGLFKIQALTIKENLNSDFITLGIEPTLKKFVKTNLTERIQKQYPTSALIYESFIPEYKEGTYTFILQIKKPDPSSGKFISENFVFSCFRAKSQIYILTRSLPSELNTDTMTKLAETKILDFYSQISFSPKFIEPKPISLDLDPNALADNDEEDDGEDEEEEGGSGGGGGSSAEMAIDLSGLFNVLKERAYIPKGKLNVKPERFKTNQARFKTPSFKTNSQYHFKPSRTKNFSSPRKWKP